MATYYKRNTNPTNVNWNQNDNWSTVSSASATNAGTFPVAADTAILDSGSTSFTVNVASACTTLTMTGYLGTLTMTSTLTVTGAVTLGGAFAGTGALILSGGSQTITSNSVTIPTLTISGTGTKTLTGNASVSGVTTISAITTLAGTGDLTTAGNLVVSSAISGRTITRTGGTWSGTATVSSNLTFNGNSTISGAVSFGTSTMTYTSGTITMSSVVLSLAAACTMFTGSNMKFSAITTAITGSPGTVTLNDDLWCLGAFSNNSNCYFAPTSATYKVYIGGNLGHATNAMIYGGTAETILNGTGTWNNNSVTMRNKVIIDTAGTISLGNITLNTTGSLYYVAGTVTRVSSLSVIRLNTTATLDIENIGVRLNFTSATNVTVTLLSKLYADIVTANTGLDIIFTGNYDYDFNTLSLSPSSTNATVTFVAGQTLTLGSIITYIINGYVGEIESDSAGTPFNLVFTGTDTDALLTGTIFTDVDVTASFPMTTWYGTVSNSTGVRSATIADLGGGGLTLSIN